MHLSAEVEPSLAEEQQQVHGDVDEPATAGAKKSLRGRLIGVAKIVVLVAMVAFAGVALARNWDDVSAALKQLEPWVVVTSLPAVALAMGSAMLVWRTLLADLGAPLTVRTSAKIFFISQLGKYLPGSVWSIATQMELGREHKVPRRVGFAVGVLALILTAGVGFPVAVATLWFAAPDVLGRYWWGLLAIPVLLALLHPAVLGRLANFGFKVIRQPPLPRRPTLKGMAAAAGWQALVSVFFGIHAWILLLGVGAPVGRSLLAAIGGYALAYSLGLLAIPVPAGAGIRDIALVAAFTAVVSLPVATAVAVVSRVALTVIDLSLASGTYFATRKRRP